MQLVEVRLPFRERIHADRVAHLREHLVTHAHANSVVGSVFLHVKGVGMGPMTAGPCQRVAAQHLPHDSTALVAPLGKRLEDGGEAFWVVLALELRRDRVAAVTKE